HLHADCRGRELLLRDVQLEEAFAVRLAEDLAVRRVAHFAVESDDIASLAAERRERLAVRLARRFLLPDLVARSGHTPVRREAVRLPVECRPGHLHADGALASQLADARLRILERLAVLAVQVRNGRDA